MSRALWPSRTVWGAAFFFILTWAGPALGHRVNVFVYVDGDAVVAECGYSRSERVRFGEIEVADAATGHVYLTGKTDEKGTFRFPVPAAARAAKADLRVLLRAGEGHQNAGLIKAQEYLTAVTEAAPVPLPTSPATVTASATVPAAQAAVSGLAGTEPAPAGGPMAADAPVAASQSVPAALQAGPTVATMDPAALEALVENAVEKKIAPLRAMLVAGQEKGPGLSEIIGGIGWLVGLAGMAAACRSRRGRPNP
ncbi:hypothetical protein [Solidesulfovibrio sp.]